MKFLQKYVQVFLALILIILSGSGMQSCIEKDPPTRITQVLLVPLSPNAGPVDFSINGSLYATTVNYSTTVGTVRYTLPYFTVSPNAASTIAYNITGSTTAFASVMANLQENKVYSTFLIDSLSKIKAVVVNDDLTDPKPGKVKIRFFHFSPNTPALDVINSATGDKLFLNRSFNDQEANMVYENFMEIDPGAYTFIFKNVTTGAVIYTTPAQTLVTDRIYTLAIRGFNGGTAAQSIGAWVYPNKP